MLMSQSPRSRVSGGKSGPVLGELVCHLLVEVAWPLAARHSKSRRESLQAKGLEERKLEEEKKCTKSIT